MNSFEGAIDCNRIMDVHMGLDRDLTPCPVAPVYIPLDSEGSLFYLSRVVGALSIKLTDGLGHLL